MKIRPSLFIGGRFDRRVIRKGESCVDEIYAILSYLLARYPQRKRWWSMTNSSRFKSPTIGDLDGDGVALYETITKGRRGTSKQYFQLVLDDSSLSGPFGAMLLAPKIGMSLQQLGTVLRFEGTLTPRHREAIILFVAGKSGSKFEAMAHGRIAVDCDLNQAEIDSLIGGDVSGFEPSLLVFLKMAKELFEDNSISDDCFAELEVHYDQNTIFEAVVLVGYYRLLADVMATFQIE